MSKLLMSTDSDTKASYSKNTSANTVYCSSNKLSQLSSSNSLQIPLRNTGILDIKQMHRLSKFNQVQGTPTIHNSPRKYSSFEKWSNFIESSHKALKELKGSEILKTLDKKDCVTYEINNPLIIPSKEKTKSITLINDIETRNERLSLPSINRETAKNEITENFNIKEIMKGDKDINEKNDELIEVKKEVESLKKIYTKFEEIYCFEKQSLEKKLEESAVKCKVIEDEYKKALVQIKILNDKYKQSLEVISNNQQRYYKEISRLQEKVKDVYELETSQKYNEFSKKGYSSIKKSVEDIDVNQVEKL